MKRLTPEDAALLASIGGESLLESHGHSAPLPIMQAYRDRSFNEATCRAELEMEQNIFTAIFYNGIAAGYSKIVVDVPHPAVSLQPVTKLERLYLLKKFYGLKLGEQLLQQILKFSKASDNKGTWLEVWKGNERAIRFYEKQGFRMVGEMSFQLTETYANPAWVMLLPY